MPKETFYIKRDDTSPEILVVIDGVEANLVEAEARFQMRDRFGKTVVDEVANIIRPFGPAMLSYEWRPADTALAGTFEAEFRVTYADDSVETFPNAGFITVRIGEDVANL